MTGGDTDDVGGVAPFRRAMASFPSGECIPHARHDGGDHSILVPAVYFRRAFPTLVG